MKPSELIEKYGWIRNHYGSPTSGFCAAGALLWARWTTKQPPFSPTSQPLGIWNDAPERTKEEVINVLKEWEATFYVTESP